MNRASFNPHKWVFIHAKDLGKRPEVRKLESAAAVGWMEASLELSGACGWFAEFVGWWCLLLAPSGEGVEAGGGEEAELESTQVSQAKHETLPK